MVSIPVPFRINHSGTNETMYYNSKDLQKYDPLFYWGCKSKPRNIIKKKQICKSEYLFANLKMGNWNISSAKCKKSQLLITKSWVENNMRSINDKNNQETTIKSIDDILMPLAHPRPQMETETETLQLLEKIKNLKQELETLTMKYENDIENGRCETQFLQLQLENNLQFSKLKEEKYLLQIQMLQNK
jgi:hypothetical protein